MRYFPGLNALRFIAALFVALAHTSSSLKDHHIDYVFDFSRYSLFQNGNYAVEFFFVLSGFLISSLLIDERSIHGGINIRNFYIRRVLRIWPLYYLLLLCYLLLLPVLIRVFHLPFDTHLTPSMAILYLLFLPNIVREYFPQTLLGPLWSIGVEEQFYLLWAPLMHYFYKHLTWIALLIILVKGLFNAYVLYAYPQDNGQCIDPVLRLIQHLKIECMAIGALGAQLLFYQKERLRRIVRYPSLQLAMLCLLGMLLFSKSVLMVSATGIFLLEEASGILFRSCLFIYLILVVCVNPVFFGHRRLQWLNQLGDVSYGMYMYHISVEMFLLNMMQPCFRFKQVWLSTTVYYTVFIAMTIVIAGLSYHLFEKPFLHLKRKYTVRSRYMPYLSTKTIS